MTIRPLFTNNAATALAKAITPTDNVLQITAGTGSYFPQPTGGNYFYLTLIQINNPEVSEIVKCIDRTGDYLTVERGQEGTQPQIFNISDNVELRITAASLNLFAIGGGGGGTGGATQIQEFTATQGQTVFSLSFSYVPNQYNLAVFVNGSKQIADVNYSEASATTISFFTGLNAGDLVEVIYNLPIAAGELDASNIRYNEGGIGAVNRTVQTRLQDYVSVKDFGAKGDGATNDTAAIQAAIASAQTYAGGSNVFFPAGNYLISSTLNIASSSVQLVGEGRGISRITSNFATGNIIQFNGVAYSGVKQLSITSSVVRTSDAAIYIAACHNVIVENIGLESNMYIGVQVEGGTNQFLTTINDFEIDSGFIGILLGNSVIASDTWIQNGVINACSGVGIQLTQASGIYMYGVDIINCSVGIETYPGAGQSVSALFADTMLCDTCWNTGWNFITNGGNVGEVMLSNCWGSTNGAHSPYTGHGLFLGQGTGKISAVSISNSTFFNNQNAGIFVQGATKVNISNCIVSVNNMHSANGASGITFYSGSSDFSVIGGMCGYDNISSLNYQSYGIYVDYSCTKYSIIGVDVTNNTSGGIQNFSPTTGHVYGNTGYLTNNSGQAFVPVGSSTVTVTHGLASTPNAGDISATPGNDLSVGGAARFWVQNITSTTFQIAVNTTVTTNSLPFSWQARTQGA